MTLSLFDAQCGFGGWRPGVRECFGAEECIAEMDRLGIERAMVRIAPDALDRDVPQSNASLYSACLDHPNFTPCPILVPAACGDFPSEAVQVDEAVAHGAGAVSLRPGADAWSLAPWSGGKLLAALEARRMPALCLQRMIGLEQVADLATRHPALPILVAETDYRQQRLLAALVQTFRNVYICVGGSYTVHRGIEQLVALAGAGRVLFGTGLPEVSPMMAVAQLMYAEISEEQKEIIGGLNLQHLIGEIRQ